MMSRSRSFSAALQKAIACVILSELCLQMFVATGFDLLLCSFHRHANALQMTALNQFTRQFRFLDMITYSCTNTATLMPTLYCHYVRKPIMSHTVVDRNEQLLAWE